MTHPAITSLSLLATRCLAGTPVTPAKPEKHPRDHEANARWACELENAPEDSVLIELFALRQGLRQRVDSALISTDKATRIFVHLTEPSSSGAARGASPFETADFVFRAHLAACRLVAFSHTSAASTIHPSDGRVRYRPPG